VQAALIVSPKTRNLTINVSVDGGRARLSGILANLDLEREIVRIVEGVPGVTKVETELESPPIEYMYP
jgi:osmotically-inducible protein OsmY